MSTTINNKKAFIYDLQNEKVLHILNPIISTKQVTLSADGKHYYLPENNIIKVFDVATGNKTKELKSDHPLGYGVFESFSVRSDEKYGIGLILHRPESYSGSTEAAEPRVVLINAETGKELWKVGISKISKLNYPKTVQFTSDDVFYLSENKKYEFFQNSKFK